MFDNTSVACVDPVPLYVPVRVPQQPRLDVAGQSGGAQVGLLLNSNIDKTFIAVCGKLMYLVEITW